MAAAELAYDVVELLRLFEVADVAGAGDHDELRIGDRVSELRAMLSGERTSSSPQISSVAPFGELHVGSRSIFAAAGFTEVSRPTLRRAVMRIDF